MRLARITAPFWAPVVVGILAGLMLWTTGLDVALGAEMGAETGAEADTKEERGIMFVKKDGYGLNTHLYLVADMERSMKFYTDAFGLTLGTILRGEDGAAFHGEMQADGETILMFGPEGTGEGGGEGPHGVSPNTGGYKPSFNSYFYVSDVDAFAARAAAAGAVVVEEPTDQFWGDRTAFLKDPDGYIWVFATQIAGAGEGEGEGK